MLSKALEMGDCSPRGLAFREHGGHSFPRTSERSEKFALFTEIFMRNLRDRENRPSNRAALSIGALLGNLEGAFGGTFEGENKNTLIWVPFVGTRGH
jgi:hypothetical protein